METSRDQAYIDLEHARVNNGRVMTSKEDRANYIVNLVTAQNAVKKAENKLSEHNKLIAFLASQAKSLK